MAKRALILGISGQDGAYLAQFLLARGYRVYGSSRDAENQSFGNLARLGLKDKVTLCSASLADFRNLLQLVSRIEPDEIYNLAGQSSVGLSFAQPVETMESIAMGNLQVLEVIRYLGALIRYYNAASSECFGNVPVGHACDEDTPFRPRSPYAAAKASAYWMTVNYRESYGLFACSGVLFNHESPLRPKRFVTRKIVSTAVRIARGENVKLEMGSLDVYRDWGYAPEYVEAMWLMLQQEEPRDYVIGTGESHSLRDFVKRVFSDLGLDWQDHVTINDALFRPSDIAYSRANPARARLELGWSAKTRFKALIRTLVEAEVASIREAGSSHEQ